MYRVSPGAAAPQKNGVPRHRPVEQSASVWHEAEMQVLLVFNSNGYCSAQRHSEVDEHSRSEKHWS